MGRAEPRRTEGKPAPLWQLAFCPAGLHWVHMGRHKVSFQIILLEPREVTSGTDVDTAARHLDFWT